ncbi:MAG: aminodeoxychorismate/anthranilate synthase component II, partial [Bacteroidota bacterium]
DLVAQHTNVEVHRNDQITLLDIENLKPQGIMLSPGPGRPVDGGISIDVVKRFAKQIPIWGVCLGHQIIAEVFGGKIIHADVPTHGKTDQLTHDNQSLFQGLSTPLQVMRYHSLLVDPQSLPVDLYPTAHTAQGEIMGIRHRVYPLEGVQFHPESVLSQGGGQMVTNWINTICS